MNMKPNRLWILCVLLTPVAAFSQKDGPTPAEECRFITAADLADSKAPAFADYSTRERGTISTAKLDLTSNPIARMYRTVLRQEMTEGPNFAGHYRVAFWGCGTSCAMFAVVNLKTGRVITAKEFKSVLGTLLYADDFLPGTDTDGWGFRYKKDSNLLVVIGDPDEDESRSGAYYFVLQNDRLRLIHTTRVRKSCENVKPRKNSPVLHVNPGRLVSARYRVLQF
jgi:hypothetical protein